MDTSLVKSSIAIPPGHVQVNKKWQGSQLGSALSKGNFYFSDGMGIVDFFTSETCPVIYVTEADILLESVYTRKIHQLAEAYGSKGVIVAHRDASFKQVQNLATIQMRLTTIPISNQMELPRLLAQMAYVESRQRNPFLTPLDAPSDDSKASIQKSLLSAIPGVGETGSKRLLSTFGHIKGVISAPREHIVDVVGPAAAKEIFSFFEHQASVL